MKRRRSFGSLMEWAKRTNRLANEINHQCGDPEHGGHVLLLHLAIYKMALYGMGAYMTMASKNGHEVFRTTGGRYFWWNGRRKVWIRPGGTARYFRYGEDEPVTNFLPVDGVSFSWCGRTYIGRTCDIVNQINGKEQ